MQNHNSRKVFHPKLSTMPRNKSEAAEQLKLYKLVTERLHIQQELQFIEQRVKLLQERMVSLDQEIETTEKGIQELRQATPPSSLLKFIQESEQTNPNPPKIQKTTRLQKSANRTTSDKKSPDNKENPETSKFETFFLEY